MNEISKQEMVAAFAQDVADAADFSQVGKPDVFGELVTEEVRYAAVRAACERLLAVLNR